jgi:IS30 family transposase
MRRTYKQLTVEDRRAIGASLDGSPTRISRELRRNSVPAKV